MQQCVSLHFIDDGMNWVYGYSFMLLLLLQDLHYRRFVSFLTREIQAGQWIGRWGCHRLGQTLQGIRRPAKHADIYISIMILTL